ncbi:hypothetical protein CFC35_40275 [Streptomyces sp. FBKL.4005]|uniref:hypothetical protein n=1 Tax=unclassified Streptomyces TaxID=2593676 RepID=UPI000B97148B|nr:MULTISPECIES: hypothetical protein [unclassified Streptomyces]MCE0444801.1 hypothetical protein [Streptomyces tricolor]OYP10451.1 hypothetical protein CFC35_40275 [Streptomyces sp. FBKL.4005]BCM72947.1 hypothetical protein EASAB2608_08281 [Streptomyces sp. EAS-AB2608]
MPLPSGSWASLKGEEQKQARIQWTEAGGIALLPCGGLFSAVRAPAHLVWAAADTEELPVVDAFLRQWFDGGAAFADLHALLSYFLVPSSTAWKWTDRHLPGVEYLGRDHYLGVPAVHLTEPQGRGYWCLPMDSAGDLCYPAVVEKLLHHGRATRSGVNAQ